MTRPREVIIDGEKYVRWEDVKVQPDLSFEVYYENLPAMTYPDAEKAVAKLGNGWRIPSMEELRLMYKNKDSIGGFIAEASRSDCPGWYWSSTEYRNSPSYVSSVRLSDGYEYWNLKDCSRLRCRPVRLVAEDK